MSTQARYWDAFFGDLLDEDSPPNLSASSRFRNDVRDKETSQASAYTALCSLLNSLVAANSLNLQDLNDPSLTTIQRAKLYNDTLSFLLYRAGLVLLRLLTGINVANQTYLNDHNVLLADLAKVLTQLQAASLLTSDAEVAFARAADRLLDKQVEDAWRKPDIHDTDSEGSYRRQHDDDDDSVVQRLVAAVADNFIPYIEAVLGLRPGLTSSGGFTGLLADPGHLPSSIDWQALALAKLSRVFSKRIYDIVASWPVKDAMLHDLRVLFPLDPALRISSILIPFKTCVTTPQTRRDLCEQFNSQLARRLLHPGRSTVDVLELYMKTISTFIAIEPAGNVLQRAAAPIRAFLHMRSDTLPIILTSLLEPAFDEKNRPRPSTDSFSFAVAQMMHEHAEGEYKEYYEASDLRSRTWTPAPIDVDAPAHHPDTLSHLISLEPADAVIAQLQSVLATRLLSSPPSAYTMELRLLRTLKNRFEDLKLQTAEIMLQDVISSALLQAPTPDDTSLASFDALTLSRYYWPPLTDQTFTLPESVQSAMSAYERTFQQKKPDRRLAWFPALGRAHVRLVLEDRTVELVVPPAQAALINAFTDPSATDRNPTRRSVAQLTQELAMPEALVRACCAFWVGRLVLREHPHQKDVFVVLERLAARPNANSISLSPHPEGTLGKSKGGTGERAVSAATAAHASLAAAQAAQTTVPGATAGLKSAEQVLQENEELYGNMVLGMLTNQGGMKAGRILMMMRAFVAGGFPFSEEELEGFLGGLEAKGRIERLGGIWKVRR